MNTQPDFEELLKLLERNKVRYMVVGGYAVAFHGFPRFTKDIDIFFVNSEENIVRIRKCLTVFGFPHDKIPRKLFTEKGNIIQLKIEFYNTQSLRFINHNSTLSLRRLHFPVRRPVRQLGIIHIGNETSESQFPFDVEFAGRLLLLPEFFLCVRRL